MKLRFLNLLVFIPTLGVLPALAAPQTSCQRRSLPLWKPDANQLRGLARATRVGDYQVRPPLGYALQTKAGPGGSQGVAWVGAARRDGTHPYLMVVTIDLPAKDARKHSLEDFLNKSLASLKRLRGADWKQTSAQSGQVSDMAFMRAYWSGAFKGTFQMHGFVYVTRVGNRFISITSQDVEPHQQATLALSEAAALTFQRAAR